jgi:hypothetical protein
MSAGLVVAVAQWRMHFSLHNNTLWNTVIWVQHTLCHKYLEHTLLCIGCLGRYVKGHMLLFL